MTACPWCNEEPQDLYGHFIESHTDKLDEWFEAQPCSIETPGFIIIDDLPSEGR